MGISCLCYIRIVWSRGINEIFYICIYMFSFFSNLLRTHLILILYIALAVSLSPIYYLPSTTLFCISFSLNHITTLTFTWTFAHFVEQQLWFRKMGKNMTWHHHKMPHIPLSIFVESPNIFHNRNTNKEISTRSFQKLQLLCFAIHKMMRTLKEVCTMLFYFAKKKTICFF